MLKIHNNPPRREWPALTARCTRQEGEITERVAAILSQVRTGGDKALRDLVARIEGYVPERFEVSRRQRTEAAKAVPQRLKTALAIAKSNIEAFHRAQLPPQVDIEVMPGVRCVQRAVAIGRVGLYVPGGNAPLFSTVLMLALPARIAGCREVILCTPCGRDGRIAPEILYAADLCGVDRVFALGGAQAVAAMAYGTESIPRVDKIFGPGNRYVTKAKQLVGANDVAVDLPAGPSEVLVLADDRVDEVLAAQLWVEVRGLPWRRPHWVAAKVAGQLREGVLLDCGAPTHHMPHRLSTVSLGPIDPADDRLVEDDDPAVELAELLAWACAEDVITNEDRELLISLIEAAKTLQADGHAREGGVAGLSSRQLSAVVAQEWGVCARTVRRRTARCVAALSEAAVEYLNAVG